MSQLNDALEEIIFVKIHVYKENAGYLEVRVIELEERGFKGVFLSESTSHLHQNHLGMLVPVKLLGPPQANNIRIRWGGGGGGGD